MADESARREESSESAAEPMDPRTRLAYQRTFLAQQNNQMAWVRTTLALISFGFSIAEVFRMARGGPTGQIHASRVFGDLMIAVGLAVLVLTDVQHRRALANLRAQCPDLPRSSARVTGLLLGLLGLAALIGVNL